MTKSTNTILDLVERDLPEGTEGFLEAAARAPEPKDDSFLNSVKDYSKTLLKGSIEGFSRFGKMLGPLQSGKSSSQELEEQTGALDEMLPTDEGFVQRSIRRGLKEAPSMMAFPVAGTQVLPRTMMAGFMGEGAKDLGLPEWAQTAAELTAYIGPDVTKKLLSSGKDKEIIDWAKKMGMTDEQITPIIQSDFKKNWLSKIVSKRGSTEKSLKSSQSSISNVYSTIEQSPHAQKSINASEKNKMTLEFKNLLFNMPANVRNAIKADIQDLYRQPINGQTLMNFWKDINHVMGSNSKELSLLKNPVKKALESISPELSKDFELVNKLQSKYYNIAAKLKPNMTSDIVQGVTGVAEVVGLLSGLVLGNYATMATIIGEKAARKVAQQFLINPHFQQLSRKMIVAIDQNKFGLVRKLVNDFAGEIRKTSPETADKLENMSDEELKEFLSHQKEEVDNPEE
jgi:hypothetical protein